VPRKKSSLPERDYNLFLNALKQRIRTTQVRAALAINQELILLYWHIGREILTRQQTEGWGSKVIKRLSQDLQGEFPDIKGFSQRNLAYMRAFAEAYPDEEIVQRSVAQIPWRHNLLLLDKLKTSEERLWYAKQALENGWSRDVLAIQMTSNLFDRQGGAITNFDRTLPAAQSDFAQQMIKDPYHFDFLNLGRDVQERDLEKALVERMREFLLELGVGFAFMGSQYHLEVDGEDYYLDLLFYHVQLRCYVVIDLKVTPFKPEYTGKMNFYVSAVDDMLRHPDDKPTIGMILCRSKNRTTAEYALRNIATPIAITTHQLPKHLEDTLPSVKQLESEIEATAKALEKNTDGFDDETDEESNTP
jgi:predicted nuclease of restriction endonuclease-like (RecB) superfamily